MLQYKLDPEEKRKIVEELTRQIKKGLKGTNYELVPGSVVVGHFE